MSRKFVRVETRFPIKPVALAIALMYGRRPVLWAPGLQWVTK